MSKPTVVISIVDGSFSSLHSTARAWHIDAVRGRPPHQILSPHKPRGVLKMLWALMLRYNDKRDYRKYADGTAPRTTRYGRRIFVTDAALEAYLAQHSEDGK
jgi:hypothetical protein